METLIDRAHLIKKAEKNIKDILDIAIEYAAPHKALVVYDTENELTRIVTDAYRNVLPEAEFLDFNGVSKQTIINAFDALAPRDLVVLIQSTDFRLNEFRIRIHLFQHKLKVIDHLHLYRNTQDSWETYIDALAYDPLWYRGTGRRLKHILDATKELQIKSRDNTLTITGGLEESKVNIGDYTGMENIGGTFPIGEVFTEARDLTRMNGAINIFAFANQEFEVSMYDPFAIHIENGLLVGWDTNAPTIFKEIVETVKAHERPLIREIGFGLNRAISREHYLKDITAFERILGMHLSLGEKHTVFKKQGITADKTRFHVDLFPVVDQVFADETLIFKDSQYQIDLI